MDTFDNDSDLGDGVPGLGHVRGSRALGGFGGSGLRWEFWFRV